MLRSMYSGVAGMKAHQTKMDVIGNNIANVNTYGFKASRTTFSEVFYQTTSAASGATPNSGGKNASQIGYGSKVSGIDLLMTRSGFQSTDKATDVAIAGEGFFQVADADGNKYFTRAGNFLFDSMGNLVDANGNFVLGVSGDPMGIGPSSDRIRVEVGSVDPNVSRFEDFINSKKITIESSEKTKDANVSFSFETDPKMAAGDRVRATISSGVINIYLNPDETFADHADFEKAVNDAITAANGEKPHPGGKFTIKAEGEKGVDVFAGLTGEEIVSQEYKPVLGGVEVPKEMSDLDMTVSTVGNTFGKSFTGSLVPTYNITYSSTNKNVIFEAVIGGQTYRGEITTTHDSSGTVKLVNTTTPDASDYIILKHPGYDTLSKTLPDGTALVTTPVTDDAKASEASKALGFGTKQLVCEGGTAGGAQSISDLTNITIGQDGVITATHATHGLIEIGRIDLATFQNPAGLMQAGNSYFQVSTNSGAAEIKLPGSDGTGALQSNALEMSNVDLSQEFADMITTQRGFQASSRMITVSDEILQELVNLKR